MNPWIVGILVFAIGFWMGKRVGRYQVALYVWNVLVNNRNKDKAGAICLYMLKYLPSVMLKNEFKNFDEACDAIKSGRTLVDS